jgi:hypothetical protein
VTFFSLVLFLHVVAALSMFAVLVVEVVRLSRIRRALTFEEALRWIDVSPGWLAVLIGSPPVLFASGGYMVRELAAWNFAWPKVAAVALGVVSLLGAIAGRRMRAIRRSSSVGDRSEAVLLSRLHNPLLRITLSLRVALVLGIVYLMTATPDLFKSVVGIAISAAFGLGWALLGGRPTTTTSPVMRDVGIALNEAKNP